MPGGHLQQYCVPLMTVLSNAHSDAGWNGRCLSSLSIASPITTRVGYFCSKDHKVTTNHVLCWCKVWVLLWSHSYKDCCHRSSQCKKDSDCIVAQHWAWIPEGCPILEWRLLPAHAMLLTALVDSCKVCHISPALSLTQQDRQTQALSRWSKVQCVTSGNQMHEAIPLLWTSTLATKQFGSPFAVADSSRFWYSNSV